MTFKRIITIVFAVGMLGLLLWVGSADHKPNHPCRPAWKCVTTTTTIPPATTTTTIPPSTTTTVPPSTTTTVPPTTTTTVPVVGLSLTEDLVIDGTVHTFSGHIEGNGFEILVTNGGSLDWDGFTVNNVARIIFTGCAAPSTLRNGLVDNSGVAGVLGMYPIHWHLEGDCSRGTVVDNVTVRNGANHAFVPHGSHGITLLNTRAETILGHAYWWDPPGTNRITCSPEAHRKFCVDDNTDDLLIDGAVATGVYWSRDIDPCCATWHRISAFVLGSGSGNVIRNSVASDITGGANCAGFFWPGFSNSGWTFTGNRVENIRNCHGIAVWQNNANVHLIPGFTGGGIDHGAYLNVYEYQNVTVPYLNVHALGWSMSDSSVGNVTVFRHTLSGDPVVFTNVTFGSFTINDGQNGIHPGTYVLNGSNLTCGDIIYQNVMPDSRVVIDGGEC